MRLWRWGRGGRDFEREMNEEMRFHVERQAAENVAAGMTADEARRQAALQFGGVEGVKETCRSERRGHWFETVLQDVRYGVRMLRKSPGFTAVVVITLALGVGADTAMFTILNAAALRPLPAPSATQLVAVAQHIRGRVHRNVNDDESFVSYSEYEMYAKETHSLSGLLAYSPYTATTLVTDKPQSIMGTLASCNYFSVLGIRPQHGRFFTSSDCAARGGSAVVVLGDSEWRRAFGGDPGIVGKTIQLNRTLFVVIGIARPEFSGTVPNPSAFWAPLTMAKAFRPADDELGDDYLSWLGMIGRLKPGVSARRAAADLNVIASRLNASQRGRATTVSLSGATLLSSPSMRRPMLILSGFIMGMVGLVLMLACANIANMLLARAAGRRKEMAVRLTVGASRGRLVRQLLTESLLLALLGGAGGALASYWSAAGLLRFTMKFFPPGPRYALVLHLNPDWRTWSYALVLSVATACLFGLAPALRVSHVNLTAAMKGEEAYSESGTNGTSLLRNSLVGAQVATCMLLLLCSGLLLHGLYRAERVSPGFEMKNIETVAFNLSNANYTEQRAAAFQQQCYERIAALPGVDQVAQARAIPLANFHYGSGFETNGYRDTVEFNNVSANFFKVLGIPIVQGRAFTDEEARAGAHVMVLSESTARRFFPSRSPIGQTLLGGVPGFDKRVPWKIVGVAADAQVANLGDSQKLYLYETAGPAEQSSVNLLVHTSAADPAIGKEIQAIIGGLDPALNAGIGRLSDTLALWLEPARALSLFSTILGALALLLASLGIYGTVSYGVSRRVHEIGVRVALGANSRDVMWLVVRQAMVPVLAGVLAGIILCAAASSILSASLFGVSPLDPGSFAGMPLLLVLVALLASYIPARRAMRVDPMVALRHE